MAWADRHAWALAIGLAPFGPLAAWLVGWREPALTWPGTRLLLLGVVAAPVLEEIVFRGGLQEALRRHDIRGANVIASVLFGLAHALVWRSLAGLGVILPSLLIGQVYDRERRLAPVIGLHSGYNMLWLCLGTA